jgi:hypothetical protein
MASQSHRICAADSSSCRHFSQVGSSVSPSLKRCPLRWQYPVKILLNFFPLLIKLKENFSFQHFFIFPNYVYQNDRALSGKLGRWKNLFPRARYLPPVTSPLFSFFLPPPLSLMLQKVKLCV